MEGRNYKVGREEIVEKLGKLLKTEGIARIGIVDFEKVFSLYVEIPQLAFADCSHAVWALEMPNQTIVSFDTDYSRVNGLTWLMPPHVPNQ
jgi:predicted nucleic acid-binding protein